MLFQWTTVICINIWHFTWCFWCLNEIGFGGGCNCNCNCGIIMLAYFNTTTHFFSCFIADNESKKNETKKEYDNHRKYAYIFLTTRFRPLSTQWIPLTYLNWRNDYIAVAAAAVILAMAYTPHVPQYCVKCIGLHYLTSFIRKICVLATQRWRWRRRQQQQ